MSFYSIRRKELTAIADAIRAKTGKSGDMSVEDMPKEIGEIESGNKKAAMMVSISVDDPVDIVNTLVQITTSISISAEKYYTHALYNGVRLPRIPDSVLASYPYAWIRLDTNTGYYELFMATRKWYGWNNGSGTEITAMGHEDSDPIKWYRIATTSSGNAIVWTYYRDYTANNFGISETRSIVWSNHDIPNGSADATEIYFTGSEPVPID